MKLLLDTNVLVDYFGARRPFCDQWELINALQMTGYAELWASAESYTDAFYLLRRAVGSEKLQGMFLESLSFVRGVLGGRGRYSQSGRAIMVRF